MASLNTTYVGLSLQTPLIVASAGITETVELMRRCEENGAGAVVMKSYFEEVISRKSPTPRFRVLEHNLGKERTFTLMSYEQASGWDIQRYAQEVSDAKARLRTLKIIPSLNCITEQGWVEGAILLEQAGADAIELNTSCPHGSITFRGGAVEESIFSTVRAVRAAVSLPLVAKISPMLTSPMGVIKGVEERGINGVTAFNRMTALDIDIQAERATMPGGYAGHGGPWAIQYPLRWISEISPQIGIDIAGSGGVASYEDVVKYLLAGATAVQTCTAVVMNGYGILREFVQGLERYMVEKGYEDIDAFRGRAAQHILGTFEIDRSQNMAASIDPKWTAPCTSACPLSVPVQAYVHLIAEGKFAEALEQVRSKNPFQSICGRVCYHPCETECTRGHLDEPVAIMALKRFLTEWGRTHAPLSGLQGEKKADTGKKIAVVGSGPAGLSAAHDLARLGHQVTVFEALPVPGGMMAVGIPEYRLPKALLDEEIDAIEALGVQIRTRTPIGDDISLDDLSSQFEATFLAIGAHQSARLGIDGESSEGVVHAIEFLRKVRLGETDSVSGKIAVIGGGNTAIDAARCAIRLGAEEVYLVYRRTRAEMPAANWEIREAEEEGVRVLYLIAPIEILAADGKVRGLRCRNHFLGDPDEGGRRRPQPVLGAEFVLDVDWVIPAVSQTPDLGLLGATSLDLSLPHPPGADRDTGVTSVPGLFVGGDMTGGPGTLISAITDGKNAARSIDAYLSGIPASGVPERIPVDKREVIRRNRDETPASRVTIPHSAPDVRRTTFGEMVGDLGEAAAIAEARRCLACGCGTGCGICSRVCIYDAVDLEGDRYQINDQCAGCGLCTQRCPHRTISMVRKACS
ncbi:MAG: FAD-dependent oxidoreductase [Candidatus Latescibacterota bacterium]